MTHYAVLPQHSELLKGGSAWSEKSWADFGILAWGVSRITGSLENGTFKKI